MSRPGGSCPVGAASWGRVEPLTKRGSSALQSAMTSSWFLLPASIMFARASVCSACKRPVTLRLLRHPRNQYLHASPALGLPRRKDFFSSNAHLAQKQLSKNDETGEQLDNQKQRRRSGRAPAAPTSLRRVAVEAQRSRDGFLSKAQLKEQGMQTKVRHLRVRQWAGTDLRCVIDSDRLRRS